MLERLVKAAAPNMPRDRRVESRRDPAIWYQIGGIIPTLFVPPEHILRMNVIELDSFIEAVNAFAKADLSAPKYIWDKSKLTLENYSGEAAAVALHDLRNLLLKRDPEDRIIACDIETRRIEWEDNYLLAIGFAYEDNACLAIHRLQNNKMQMDEQVREAVQEFLLEPSFTFIWHNGKFDCGRLKYLCNIDARVDEDTMLQHYAQINERRGTHSLKQLGPLYLQAPHWEEELEALKKSWCKAHKLKLEEFMYDYVPLSQLVPYMQMDCIATRRLWSLFKQLARPDSEFIYRKLIEASNVYKQVELNGQRLDFDYMEDLEYELDCNIQAATKKLNEVSAKVWNPRLYQQMTGARTVPNEFNPKSPKQLKWMLEEVLGHSIPSTDQNQMAYLLEQMEAGRITNPLAKEFLESIGELRKYTKYMDTFVQGMREVVCRDHRIRCVFNLHGTETGRLSSSSPNMQNIPRNKTIRNLLVATPGYKLLQLDYSQAELRVLAMLSDDDHLIQIYTDGKDLHDAIAESMFGPNFDKEQRNLAKTINFGIAYGRGPSSISEKFGKSIAESKEIIAKWFAPMPKVKFYLDERRRMALKGEPCTTPLGRSRHFVITSEDMNHIQNEYINTPIQSLASDFTMLSLLEIAKYLDQLEPGTARITTNVHDSIMLEVRDGDEELLKGIARKCVEVMKETPQQLMAGFIKPFYTTLTLPGAREQARQKWLENPQVIGCRVPFKADVEVGYKWGELEKLAL